MGAVIFKLGTRNVHYKRNRITQVYYVATMAPLLAPVSFSGKPNNIPMFNF